MKQVIFFGISLLIAVASQSQHLQTDSLKKKKIEYYFQFQSGTLIGCASCSDGKQIGFSGSTTHGIKMGKRLRVGGAIGLDSYFQSNTMPVFGSLSWDLFKRKNALYIEVNYGGALASWKPINFDEYGHQKTHPGRMYSYGVGYRIAYDKIRISVGIGRKTQWMTSYYEYPTYYWNNNSYVMGDPNRRILKNEMNRLAIWMAVGLK
jgi:hypothetical protein